MKRICFALFIFTGFYNISGQTITETVNMALQNSSQIKAQKAQTQAAASNWQSTKLEQLPNISADASYRHVTDIPSLDLPINMTGSGNIILGSYDTYEAGLNLSYTVFGGFAQTEATRIKEFEYKISEIQETQSEKEIAFSTIEAYRNAQIINLNIEILKQAYTRNENLNSRIVALLENGMALALDTMSLALARLDIEQQLIQTKAFYSNWLQILSNLSGHTISPIQEKNLTSNPTFADFSAAEQTSLKSIHFQQDIANSLSKIEQADYYPKIKLGASIKHGRPGVDFIKNEWMTYGVWTVGLSWDIWSWGADKAAVKASILKNNALKLQEETITDKLKLAYDSAKRFFTGLQEQLMVAKKARILAQEKMRIIEAYTNQGQATITEFNDANLEFSQAELRYYKTLINLNLKASELDYLSGQPFSKWRLEQ